MPARLRRRTALFALARAFRSGGPSVGTRLAALPRLARASLRGEYDAGTRLFLMAGAALYVVSPLDAMPELVLAFVGLVDDALVVTWLTGALLSETDRFLEWERQRATVIPARVVQR